MNRPGGFPDELRGAKLLFILDDLHRRTASEITNTGRYLDRLDAFLHFFEQALAPGEFYALATARTEPHHRAQLGLDAPHPLWDRLKFYELPEFTQAGLRLMLVELAKRAGVDLESGQVEAMVSNSDRTIRTLVANVDRAQWRGERLTLQSWQPTQGKTWEVRSNESRAHWRGVDQVFRALHLIRVAGLPTRFEYVARLGSRLGEGEITPATEGLVDMGLLGLRGGVLDAFGDEQLADSLRAVGAGLPDLATQWDPIIDAVTTAVGEHPNWSRDLYHLAVALIEAKRYQDAELVVAAAIERGQDDATVYYRRGEARSNQKEYKKALADYNKAIRLDPKDATASCARAWLWATCPETKYRDGKRAVESATRACELTKWKDAALLDTLAAAYAESGDFDAAVKWQKKAMDLLPKDDEWDRKDYGSRLELYRAKKPYREMPEAQ